MTVVFQLFINMVELPFGFCKCLWTFPFEYTLVCSIFVITFIFFLIDYTQWLGKNSRVIKYSNLFVYKQATRNFTSWPRKPNMSCALSSVILMIIQDMQNTQIFPSEMPRLITDWLSVATLVPLVSFSMSSFIVY